MSSEEAQNRQQAAMKHAQQQIEVALGRIAPGLRDRAIEGLALYSEFLSNRPEKALLDAVVERLRGANHNPILEEAHRSGVIMEGAPSVFSEWRVKQVNGEYIGVHPSGYSTVKTREIDVIRDAVEYGWVNKLPHWDDTLIANSEPLYTSQELGAMRERQRARRNSFEARLLALDANLAAIEGEPF